MVSGSEVDNFPIVEPVGSFSATLLLSSTMSVGCSLASLTVIVNALAKAADALSLVSTRIV